MQIAIQKGRAIVLALFLLITPLILFAPKAHADNWSRIQSHVWQAGNFACNAVRVIGHNFGAAPYAEWSLERITSGVLTDSERYIALALGAAQKCPEDLQFFTYQLPPGVAINIAAPPPAPLVDYSLSNR